MARCRVDPQLQRKVINGFQFPLGVYPIEEMVPRQGYSITFEPADGSPPPNEDGPDEAPGSPLPGGPDDAWEEWPDRFAFEIVVSADRLEPLCRGLLALMPGRIYPILDVLGQDAYREVDPYVSYELTGLDRFTDALRRFSGFFFEDGLIGFGAMMDGESEDEEDFDRPPPPGPRQTFFYIFVDEHKIITVRAVPEMKERVEKLLAAYNLEEIEDPAGADFVQHEHRGVLVSPEDRPDLLTPEEIVERLREDWRLTLNIDPDTNVDDDGNDLGVTPWRCLLRAATDEKDPGRYAEVLLSADCLRKAEDLALAALDELRPAEIPNWDEAAVVQADRVLHDELIEFIDRAPPEAKARKPREPGAAARHQRVWARWWLK